LKVPVLPGRKGMGLMNKIMGVDPGTRESGVVIYDFQNNKLIDAVILENKALVDYIEDLEDPGSPIIDMVAFEKVASYGMAVGAEVFETVFWTGRFFEAIGQYHKIEKFRITRNEVKNHLCHSSRAKDSNIRQALIDRFGEPGTKKNPGVLFGIKSHLWPALAVAVTMYDTQALRQPE
jgi:hypothetical protein